MQDNKTLKGIQGYLRSTFPLYKLSKNSRFITKNVSTLIEYSCFETPAYFSKKYNLNYRMQAYAKNVIYTQNSKSNSILFDLGSKQLITQDSTAFLQTTRPTNYGRLNKNVLYQLFPSMHRRLITQQLSSSAGTSYLSKQNSLLLSAEPWFNSKLKPAVQRKTNYLFPSKLLSNEFDQLISKFDSEWAAILKTKSSSYCLATPSRYFSLIVDADSNWNSLPYQFFRYYEAMSAKIKLLTKKFNGFWFDLIAARSTVSLDNTMLSTYNLLFNQITCNLNWKLKVNVLNLGVGASVIKNKTLLICSYAKNFLFSLLISMLFRQQANSQTWIFNRLSTAHKSTKMLLEQGVTLLAKIKAVLPAKCLSLVETVNHFFFQPTQLRYGTGISMLNDGLKLRRMLTYLVNKKTQYSLNVVNNTGAQNFITLMAKFQRTNNLLTKVKFNIENLKIYMLNLKQNIIVNKGLYLQLLALRMQLVTFQTQIPEWTYNLQFALSKTFNNANYWLRNQVKTAYNLIFNYLSLYARALKKKCRFRFNKQGLLKSIFFYFYIKRSKKVMTTAWLKIERIYSNYFKLISKNYHLFRWFHTTLSSSSNLIRTIWMRLFTKKSLFPVSNRRILSKKTNVVNLRNRIRFFNDYNLIPNYKYKNFSSLMRARAVFWNYNFYKSELKYHKISKHFMHKFGKAKKLAVIRPVKVVKTSNYKGKNYDPNYKWKKKLKKRLEKQQEKGLFRPLLTGEGKNKKHFIKQS